MGFWSSAGKITLSIGKSALDKTQKTLADTDKLKEKYENYDDDRLKEILRSGKTAEKMAATHWLKKRGYGQS